MSTIEISSLSLSPLFVILQNLHMTVTVLFKLPELLPVAALEEATKYTDVVADFGSGSFPNKLTTPYYSDSISPVNHQPPS